MIATQARVPFRLSRAILVLSMASAPAVGIAALRPESVAAWTTYVTATDQRMARELSSKSQFLALDVGPNATVQRRAILGGAIVVDPMEAVDVRGEAIDVPSAMVHHWRGAVLIPGARLEDLLTKLQSAAPGTKQEDVLQSKVLARGPDWMKVYLRLQRKKFVTVVYNTEHVVTFRRHGAGRASSASTATKIAEVESAGTPAERELPPGQDRGFLWRWHAYWRYEQVPGGVIAECESISLSRGIPSVIRSLVAPLIDSTARESMERTLATLRLNHRATQ